MKNYSGELKLKGSLDYFFKMCKSFVKIQAEDNNAFDENAIRVDILGKRVGYIPANLALLTRQKGVFEGSTAGVVNFYPNKVKSNLFLDLAAYWSKEYYPKIKKEIKKREIPIKKAQFLNLKQMRNKIRVK